MDATEIKVETDPHIGVVPTEITYRMTVEEAKQVASLLGNLPSSSLQEFGLNSSTLSEVYYGITGVLDRFYDDGGLIHPPKMTLARREGA